MSDNEAWRQKRAEELGLVDTGPSFGRAAFPSPPRRPRAVAEDTVDPMRLPEAPARQAGPTAAAPPIWPQAVRVPPLRRGTRPVLPGWARPELIIAALIVAAMLGWMARSALLPGTSTPVATVSDVPTSVAAPPTVPVAARPSLPAPPPPRVEPAAPDVALRAEPPAVAAVTERVAKPFPPTTATADEAAASRPPVTSRARYPARPVAAPGRSFKPSFNCRLARSAVTQMICADARLAALDVEMAARYRAAVRGIDPEAEQLIETDQSTFLNTRSRCNSQACVSRAYEDRIDELASLADR